VTAAGPAPPAGDDPAAATGAAPATDRAGPPRAARPEDPAWRADALAASRHSRLLDELCEPLADFDPGRAAALCGEVCRAALRDLAPALLLLPAAERARARALAAYAYTLFDFARQGGVEGERLAQINRWEFALEQALEGAPAGQPVFVRMAAEERRRPWPRPPLRALAGAARARATAAPPGDAAAAQRAERRLGLALAGALRDGEPAAPVGDLAAALLRLDALQRLADELRRGPPRLPLLTAREDLAAHPGGAARAWVEAARAAWSELRERLDAARPAVAAVPAAQRAAARYLLLAATRLARRGAAAPDPLGSPPQLGAGERIALLLRSRF
jgi:hypothetical protein